MFKRSRSDTRRIPLDIQLNAAKRNFLTFTGVDKSLCYADSCWNGWVEKIAVNISFWYE